MFNANTAHPLLSLRASGEKGIGGISRLDWSSLTEKQRCEQIFTNAMFIMGVS